PVDRAKLTHNEPRLSKLTRLSHEASRTVGNGAARRPLLKTQRLQYNTVIPDTAGNPVAIEIFQQRNGVLPGYARQILEVPDGKPFTAGPLIIRYQRPRAFHGIAMEHHIRANLQEHAFADQKLENLLGLNPIDVQRGNDRIDIGCGESTAREFSFDLLFCAGLLGLQPNLSSGAFEQVAG